MQEVSEANETIGRYQVLKPLAQGGMAEIFLAKQEGPAGFGKTVVVKRVLSHLASDEGFVEMFQDEAKLAAKLSHPNVVQILDFGQDDGTYYLTMEYLVGEDLATIIKQATLRGRPISPQIAALISSHVLEGLHYAHTLTGENGEPLGIVHRDVSPSNVMVTYQGQVKILDFGIAKAAGKSVKTQVGTVKGKFMYMSPEQARGRPLDGRSDVFALGAVLYEMLTGVRVFQRENQMATLMAVTEQPVPNPRRHRPDLPDEIEEILMRALEKDPAGRFASAQTMREALDEYLATRTYAPSHVQLRQFLLDLFGREHAAKKHKLPGVAAGAAATVDTAVQGRSRSKQERSGSEPKASVSVAFGSDEDISEHSTRAPKEQAAKPSGPFTEPVTPVDSSLPSGVEQEPEGEGEDGELDVSLDEYALGNMPTKLVSVSEIEEKGRAAREARERSLGEPAALLHEEADETVIGDGPSLADQLEPYEYDSPGEGYGDDEGYDEEYARPRRPLALALGLGVGGALAAGLVAVFVFVGGGAEDLHQPRPFGGSAPAVDAEDDGAVHQPLEVDTVGTSGEIEPGSYAEAHEHMQDENDPSLRAELDPEGEPPSDVDGAAEGPADPNSDVEPPHPEPNEVAEPLVESEPEVAEQPRRTPPPRKQRPTKRRRPPAPTQGTQAPAAPAETSRAAEPAKAEPAAGGEGTLMVNCIPWCQIFINDRDIDRTSPARDIRLSAGTHRLKVVHPPTGMERFEDVVIRPGQETITVVRF